MDKYEITVGRFRAFLADYDRWISTAGGSHPTAGEGEHVPGYGSGWQAAWNPGDELPASASVFRDTSHLKCDSTYQTWRDTAGTTAAENLPINCIDWYEAFAFCIWDGGRLATEAEWEYAAAGGGEERTYPWGATPAPSSSYASYDCMGDGSAAGNYAYADILPVGSKVLGNGRWSQSDLAGNLWDWVFDWWASPYSATCNNCANITATFNRAVRGGYWGSNATILTAANRYNYTPAMHLNSIGARCVRTLP
jgi:formylglycine-generating enzyme required for sulfatase activity